MASILCVDDDATRLVLLKQRLEGAGHSVVTAQTGSAAVHLFDLRPFDLAVVDYKMPGMDGSEVARAMRQMNPKVPILIFSGLLSLPERVMAMVDGFIYAGEDADALLTEIARRVPARMAS